MKEMKSQRGTMCSAKTVNMHHIPTYCMAPPSRRKMEFAILDFISIQEEDSEPDLPTTVEPAAT